MSVCDMVILCVSFHTTINWTSVGHPTCQNGGVCKRGFCQCPPGFEGPQCETGTYAYHGVWVSMGGDSYLYGTHSTPVSSLLYTACIHQPELEPCGMFYCSNGGECVNDTSCQCAAGFGGESCNLAFCECRACMWGSTLW